MENKFGDFEMEASSQRPTFLTVLCILTFIGSGWAILSSVWAYTTAAQTVNLFHSKQIMNERYLANRNDSVKLQDSLKFQKHKESPGYLLGHKFGESMKTMLTVDNIHKKSIGDLIAALFTLGGAILMWFQKRRGFYLYIIGVVISIAMPFYLYGNDMVTVGIASVSAFFGLLFIALYAVNLKSLYK